MKTLTPSLVRHIYLFWTLPLYCLGCIFAYYYVVNNYDEYNFGGLYSSLWGLVIILSVIQIPLHIKYTLLNGNAKLILKSKEKQIEYISGKKSIRFTNDEVERVIIQKTASKAVKGLQLLPWEDYCYMCFQLKDGRKVWITSLLAEDRDIPWKLKNSKLVKFIYPWPSSLMLIGL